MENNSLAKIDNVIINGDLQSLAPSEKVMYYKKVCESLNLNPLTKPFEFIKLNGKLTLYARKEATDQLRAIHGISINITAREKIEDIYVVTAKATNAAGRCDESIGAVNLANLRGDALANAIMKAETKAKRRATLSIAGLALLDENEVTTIRGAEAVEFDVETGEIIEGKVEPAKPPINSNLMNETLDAIQLEDWELAMEIMSRDPIQKLLIWNSLTQGQRDLINDYKKRNK
jgi:hypothetical protein